MLVTTYAPTLTETALLQQCCQKVWISSTMKVQRRVTDSVCALVGRKNYSPRSACHKVKLHAVYVVRTYSSHAVGCALAVHWTFGNVTPSQGQSCTRNFTTALGVYPKGSFGISRCAAGRPICRYIHCDPRRDTRTRASPCCND